MLFPRLCRVALICNSTLRRSRQDVESAWGIIVRTCFKKSQQAQQNFQAFSRIINRNNEGRILDQACSGQS